MTGRQDTTRSAATLSARIHDDAVLGIDQIVRGTGEKRRASWSSGPDQSAIGASVAFRPEPLHERLKALTHGAGVQGHVERRRRLIEDQQF